MQGTGDDDLAGSDEHDLKKEEVSWFEKIQFKCATLLQSLPLSLPQMRRTHDTMMNPLFRFLEREVLYA